MLPRVTHGALLSALAASAGLLAGPMASDANAGGRVSVGVSIGGGYCGPRSYGCYPRSYYRPSSYCPTYYRPSYYRPSFYYGSYCGPVYRPIVVAPISCGPRYVYSTYRPAYSTTIVESETYGARTVEAERVAEVSPAPVATFASYREPVSVERETVERRTVARGRETVEREVIETRYPRPRPTVEVCPPAPPRDSISESYERLIDRGWDAITDDYSSGALDRFARAYRLRPSDAEPRIGYAIASALRSDDRTAIWSMRKAFEVDPRGAAIPSGGVVDRRVERVAHRYEDFVERRERRGRRPDADDLFMAAATRYLLGDLKSARIAIEQIYSSGCEESTRNLRDLICREDATGPSDGKPEPRHD